MGIRVDSKVELLPCLVNQPIANQDALLIMIPSSTSLSLTIKVLSPSEISIGLPSMPDNQVLSIMSKRHCSRKSRKPHGSKSWSSLQIANILLLVPTMIKFTYAIPKPTKSMSNSQVTVLSLLLLIGLQMEVLSDLSVVLMNSCSSTLVPRREIHPVLQIPLELFGLTNHVNLDGTFKVSSHQAVMVPISTLAP